MFGLIYGLYEMFTRRTQYYVVVVGLDGAGKTTLLQKVLHIYNDVKPLPPSKVGLGCLVESGRGGGGFGWRPPAAHR